jgi:hypothetical protein
LVSSAATSAAPGRGRGHQLLYKPVSAEAFRSGGRACVLQR